MLSAAHLLVGSRFFTPANSVARAIALADPVVTAGSGMLRLEGFSACCSTYVRVDLEPGAYEGDLVGKGTTNIDFNAPMRAALAQVRDADGLALSVGRLDFAIRTAGAQVVEKKVDLPLRWLRSMVAVQTYQSAMRKVFEVSAIPALRFMRSLPRASTSKTPLWVVAGPQGLRTTAQNDGDGVRFTDSSRLRVLEGLLPKARTLTLYADPHQQASAWSLDFGTMRLTLVLSAEVWRGFSGEGQALQSLVLAGEGRPAAAVRARLHWQDTLRSDALAADLQWPVADVEHALQLLGAAGLVGYDLVHGAYFHRVLPLDLAQLGDMNPRLTDARALLQSGAVRLLSNTPLDAEVHSGDVSYRIREGPHSRSCWRNRARTERRPKDVMRLKAVSGAWHPNWRQRHAASIGVAAADGCDAGLGLRRTVLLTAALIAILSVVVGKVEAHHLRRRRRTLGSGGSGRASNSAK